MVDINKLRRVEDCKGRLKEIVGDEGVLQLAKDGICPHYILTNPLTKEETIWFLPSELNQWFQDNFARYDSGGFVQEYNFVHFDRELNSPKGEVPVELCKIKELYEIPIQYVNTPPGIYFLCKGGKIQYIGQATNVANRVKAHVSEGVKDFDSVFFITCPVGNLNALESSLIKYFKPEANKALKGEPSESDILSAEALFKRR